MGNGRSLSDYKGQPPGVREVRWGEGITCEVGMPKIFL